MYIYCFCREKIKRPRQKRRSRWDTPSPTADLKRPSPPLAPVMGPGVNGGQRGVVQETEEETVTVIGRGRGRGWKKKKNKRGKGRYMYAVFHTERETGGGGRCPRISQV